MTAEYFESDFTSRGIPRADAAQVGASRPQRPGPLRRPGPALGRSQRQRPALVLQRRDPDQRERQPLRLRQLCRYRIRLELLLPRRRWAYRASRRAARCSWTLNNGTGASGADGLPDPVAQSIIDDIRARGLNPNDFVTADPTSPSGFVALNPIYPQFPGGYTPTFGADVEDYEGVFGAKGETGAGCAGTSACARARTTWSTT